MKLALTSLLLLTLTGMATSALAVEILKWQRLPLAVPLHVGQERIIFVDQNVRVGIPRSLKDKLRIQSTGGTLYLRANEVIEPTRLQLQNVTTGELILIDIAATDVTDSSELEPVRIVRAESENAEKPSSDIAAELPAKPRQTPIPVVLTRYAAQSLYSPLRTVERLEGVSQVRVNRALSLEGLLPVLPVSAIALGAWQLEDFWVTAVQLRNQSTADLQLDPRELQGDFVAATFQHRHLGKHGKAEDTTVLYLVTRGHGLAQSILPNQSRIDASSNLPYARETAHEK
ncbi:TIGR03749 family integrating conjugative element protein [Pseudomonas sp. CDFA 553]|uniref:TIGR03749 family integrating conjugative element protein n=1 Tax=Pseudomonas quasicaspiana TaxID=2829821 RepID=UPI002228672A|nr:TIGR03749 family integrating conjugative element protein [Pseudomonas quasicaspiana]MCD5986490.1 TIGR03749 family integrating conjugative element protein [Pseudomonas quasicaspiana]